MTGLDAQSAPPRETDAEAMLKELRDLLGRQVERIRTDDLDGATALGDRIGVLLTRIGAVIPPVLAQYAAHIHRIRALHRTLGLMLAQRKCEHADKQAELARGRNLARAYGRHARA